MIRILFFLFALVLLPSEASAKQISPSLNCLALNIYHESRSEPVEGKLAVAFVTLTRTKQRRMSVCKVVYQPKQFSWANDARDVGGNLLPEWKPKGASWQNAIDIARQAMSGVAKDPTQGSDHFFADYIKPPKWSSTMLFAGKIGRHLFYCASCSNTLATYKPVEFWKVDYSYTQNVLVKWSASSAVQQDHHTDLAAATSYTQLLGGLLELQAKSATPRQPPYRTDRHYKLWLLGRSVTPLTG